MKETPKAPSALSLRTRRRLRGQDLMHLRVHRILLVSTLYDSFILADDGQLSQALQNQFTELNLTYTPDLIRVPTGGEALAHAGRGCGYDLIITSLEVGDMDAVELARRVAQDGLDIPVVLLAYNNLELTRFRAERDTSALDRIFLWQGDVAILLAIVKYVEDRLNAPFDIGTAGVPAVILVEDDIRFYSSFLPVVYAEIMNHTHGLLTEGLNLYQQMVRLRARPKILLAQSTREAWNLFSKYQEHILGVISEVELHSQGESAPNAGLELVQRMRQVRTDLPVMLHSSAPENEKVADSIGASFLLKGSPVLLQQLRALIVESFGFGDFVFRRPSDRAEIDRARNLKELIEKLETVPTECLSYHGKRNHFSFWLKARGEFALASKLLPLRVRDFGTLENLRAELIRAISDYRRDRDRIIVADFDREHFDSNTSISRIGGGSMGGKARGLAFGNRLLHEYGIHDRYPDIDIKVPRSVVLGTDLFDEFLERNELREFALKATDDDEIVRRFLGSSLPEWVTADLAAVLRGFQSPLAVRSSGLLEDSPSQPFAGAYRTFMLRNNDPDPAVRMAELMTTVKRVYASMFLGQARAFLRLSPYRLEEEKMAVIIQRLVGSAHGKRFYPDLAGVARSFNFYPTPPLTASDGIAAVALGLGRTVVDGDPCLRFCPKHPRKLLGFESVDETLRNSQREFYALDLEGHVPGSGRTELSRYPLADAEADGTLARLASTYSHDNARISDGVSRQGLRLVTFAPILKHGLFPLAELLQDILEIGSDGTSTAVEIEFAARLSVEPGERPEFSFLQMRPMALSYEPEELEIAPAEASRIVCHSTRMLGNGRVDDILDIVVVDYDRFDRHRSREVAEQVARFNAELLFAERRYVLIGVGRWGSADPWLGIPVSWKQITGARVIVEAGLRDFKVTPSQGTHFFQNLISCNVGYFTVNPEIGEGVLDWKWLADQPSMASSELVRHIRLDAPLLIKMNGLSGEGIILKPPC